MGLLTCGGWTRRLTRCEEFIWRGGKQLPDRPLLGASGSSRRDQAGPPALLGAGRMAGLPRSFDAIISSTPSQALFSSERLFRKLRNSKSLAAFSPRACCPSTRHLPALRHDPPSGQTAINKQKDKEERWEESARDRTGSRRPVGDPPPCPRLVHRGAPRPPKNSHRWGHARRGRRLELGGVEKRILM